MTLDEIFQACLAMEVDEHRRFTLDEKPSGAGKLLSARLCAVRPVVDYSFLRNGARLDVHCYIPKLPWEM